MKSKILVLVIFVFVTTTIAFGQRNSKKITISGIVVDINQSPVKDAVIMIDGSKSGISTDKEGKYKIKVKSSVKKIGIFTLPPAVIEENIDGRTDVNFTLNDSIVKQIYRQRDLYGDEVVNIGYGTEKRKNLTTSVGKINGRQDRYASYSNIYDMIRGEVPGVQVTGTSIRIRLPSSMLSGNDPLFIVDGVPVNSIDSISPQEIKSIEVLKGSAASIYGARGSNGVLIITLKGGKSSQ